MPTALVTGANRGIGLAIAQQLHQKGYEVIGVCRQSSEELKSISGKIIEGIELSSDECIAKLTRALEGIALDVVINNAGLLEETSLDNLNFDAIDRQFQVNTLGPLRVVTAARDHLKKGSRVMNVTSRMGSVADNTSGGYYGYRMSKAALNMAAVSLAHDLKSQGIAVGLVHPGYVKTGMTGNSGHILPDEAAAGILQRLDELSLESAGTFRHANGETLPW